jgi:hypothetical protein
MHIRSEQLAVLEALSRAPFVVDLMSYVRREHHASTSQLDDAELQRLLNESIDEAAAYGISTEREVALFAGLTAELGAGFPERQRYLWIRVILEDEELSGAAKMRRIYRQFQDHESAPEA